MPPVREASTKPIAATVLPAPVACSNQKRRDAPGSSGCSGSCSSSSSCVLLGVRIPVDRLLVVVDLLVALELLLAGGQLLDDHLAVPVARRSPCGSGSRRAARSACRTARRPGGRRASCRRRGAARPRESSRSRPSISEYSRRHSTEGSSRPASISASASSSARRRAVPSASATARVLALVHERLARELLGAARSSSRTDGCGATEVLSAMRLWARRGERSLAGAADAPTGSYASRMSRRPDMGRRRGSRPCLEVES